MYFWLFFLNRSFNRILLELWETQSALWYVERKMEQFYFGQRCDKLEMKERGLKNS